MGSLTFSLGTLGIWLPGLPTTPFYLLSAFFWGQSSPRLKNYLENNRYYQKYIHQNFIERKITKNQLIKLHLFILIFMAIPFILSGLLWLRILLVIAYLVHVIGLRWWFFKGKSKADK
jgi:uncharacterized membrane protein YbaN (DUF454 family)